MQFDFPNPNRRFCGAQLRKALGRIAMLSAGLLAAFATQVSNAQPGGGGGGGFGRGAQVVDPNPRTLSPFFAPATPGPKAPSDEGFIQRWLLLDPIAHTFGGNGNYTNSFIRATVGKELFPGQFTVTPKDGDKATVNGAELAWHALDTPTFNAKLFRFAYGLSKDPYREIFCAVTIIDSPREIKNVRLAVGSNSASMWWVNGQEAVALFGDRRMVVDDVVSKRLTLKQGVNVIRGVVINGPGLSDFCARLIDESGNPVKDYSVNLEKAGK